MKYLLFIPLFILNFSLFSQHKIMNLQSENLNGKVASFTNKTFIVTKDSKELIQKYNVKYSFDKQGNLICIENFRDSNKLDSKEVFDYKQGKLTKITFYNAIGTAMKTTLYAYDDSGNLASQKKYNNQKKLQYETSYLFNQKGQLTMEQKLIPSINYTMKENYVYDDFDNLIVRTKTARIGTTKETYRYDAKSLPIKKSEFNAMGELFSVIKYEYNEYNDKISLKKYDAEDSLNYNENYEYIYDAQGNWTEKISFENGEKVSLEKRQLNYY